MTKLAFALALCSSVACADIGGSNGDKADEGDRLPPTVEITAPARGTLLDGMTITVTGRAVDADSGVKSVTVNGADAELMGDGRFEVTLELDPGLTLIETVASDNADNRGKDVRAILAGQLVADATPVPDGLIAHISVDTVGVLGNLVGGLANATDFGALAREQNPIVRSGGSCLGARVYVEEIYKSNVLVSLTPRVGGLAVTVRVVEPLITMDVDFKIACIGGDSDASIRANAYVITGWMSVGLDGNGQIVVGVPELYGNWEGFDLDVSGIPDSFVGLFVSDVPGRISNELINAIDDMLPSMAQSYLADFTASERTTNVLGHEVKFAFSPRTIEFNDQGGTIALDTNAWMPGVTGMGYLVTPSPRPDLAAMPDGQGLRLAIADDVANQLLAAFWSSGELDRSISRDDGITGFDALGDNVDHVQLQALLPPMIGVDEGGEIALTLGDLIVDIVDTSGNSLTRFAVSGTLEIEVGVREDNTLSIETGEADLTVAVLNEGTLGLTEGQLEGLTVVAMEQIGSRIDQLLLTLPIPSFGNARIAAPAFSARTGYMVLGARLEMP